MNRGNMETEKEMNTEERLFPHESVREEQRELIKSVQATLKKKEHLIVHAPTGLGKTAATLAPALSYVLQQKKEHNKDLTIFFLTSRHTQHQIAINTLKQIKSKYGTKFTVCDIIGKKHMCAQPGAQLLYSSEFSEYCKKVREENTCEFYANCRGGTNGFKLSPQGEKALGEIKAIGPTHVEVIVEACKEEKVCPYEITIEMAKSAKVVIADYSYMFHPTIRDSFLGKTRRELENCIIIIDEGHNLPERIRNTMTENLSSIMLKNAIKEAKQYGYTRAIEELARIQGIFLNYAQSLHSKQGFGSNELLITKNDFIEKVKKIRDIDAMVEDYNTLGDAIRTAQKRSFIGSIGRFLEAWSLSRDTGFTRMFSARRGKQDEILTVTNRCLDPSIMSRPVFETCHASIIMSGTLQPTNMYKDLLGFPEESTTEKVFEDPFFTDNRLSLVIPETTTKYSQRNELQFQKIAQVCARVANAVPGNSAIFFPSYDLRNKVYQYFSTDCNKTIFQEAPGMTKQEKTEMLERFKQYNKQGAVLLGVVSGNFAEGVDLPGDLLKCVVVVGLPLTNPSLEIKELISYYDTKFGRGWDYGYIFPAFIKCLQGAGRCIRSKTDRGVIVFLDERYVWPRYKRCFPEDYGVRLARDYVGEIEEFFSERNVY